VLNGLSVVIENAVGSRRKNAYPPMAHPYGYVARTEGADGDAVDIFLGPIAEDPTAPVFVVDQVKQGGAFDEHKVMYGFRNRIAARQAYFENYAIGWTGLGALTELTQDEFKTWLREGDTTKPLAKAKKPVRGAALKLPGRERDSIKNARAALAHHFEKLFAAVKRDVARQLPGLFKAADDDRVQAILEQLELDGFAALADDGTVKDILERVFAESGARALGSINFGGGDDDKLGGALDQVNDDAVKFASDQAAELVKTGDATREQLRGLVTEAVEGGWSTDELASAIEDATAFSEERADLIARTEVANAEGQGKLAGWKTSGVVTKKRWLLDADPCEVCEDNALEGPIDLNDTFPSGDDAEPAHPYCRCAVVAETDEEDNGEQGEQDDKE
jgi:hypothetical protein